MKTGKMKSLSLVVLVVFCMMAGRAYGFPPGWWWPPSGVEILPEHPTSSDVVAITLGGEWPDTCIPNDSSISVVGNDVYFDVIQDYPPGMGCFTVITGWSRTESVGPLPMGSYTVHASLQSPWFPAPYEPVAQFEVTPTTYYVDAVDGNDSNDGLTPETAFATIQRGINEANYGDTVLAAEGTYYENIGLINGKNGITLKGSGADRTIIDGGENGHVVVFNLSSGTISGFTITNSGDSPAYSAGVFTSQCSVTIADNIITNNANGIAISSDSNAVIVGNRITYSSTCGAGIYVSDSSAIIANNVVANNNGDGGICCDNSSPTIVNNTVVNNWHYGIRCNPTVTQIICNNIIAENEWGIMAVGGGGSPVPLLEISYNNVWNNTEADYWYEWGIVCIPEDPNCQPQGESEPFEPQPGTGEISQDPCFADPCNGDYHLKSQAGRWDPISEAWVLDDVTSPCIDAGDPNSPVGEEPPPHGWTINMGAYGGTERASKSTALTCWDASACAGQSQGDATCDGAIDLADLFALKANFGKCAPWVGNDCCADFTQDGCIDLADLYALKGPFGTCCLTPATGNQNCPP